MSKYLFTARYVGKGIEGLMKEGGSARREAAAKATSSLGGKLESFYFAFGSTDVFAVVDLPDNAAAAAMALTVSGSGAVTVNTTVLLTPEEEKVWQRRFQELFRPR